MFICGLTSAAGDALVVGEARKLASSRAQLGAPIFTELNSEDISSGSAAGVSNKAQNAHGAGLFTEHP